MLGVRGQTLLEETIAELEAQAQQAEPNWETREAWKRGDLSHKLLPHQRLSYDAINTWNVYRQTDAYADMVEAVGANFDDIYVDYSGRRVGKTSEKILMLAEIAVRRPGAVLTYFTALQKDIGGIIVPLARQLIMGDDCPPECKPVFMRSHHEHGMGLFFPNDSYIKLVGVDKNPDGLRGRFSDGIVGSETSFINQSAHDATTGLEYLVMSVMLPQFVGRPWAYMVLETSAPKDPEHPMLTRFVPDAKARGAYLERTLDDNTTLTKREYAKIIRQAGGRGNPHCEREYFNVTSRDPSEYVIPEFSEEHHVREATRPAHALCFVGGDPGSDDLFGEVFGYYDFVRAKLVIEASWAMRNPSTRHAACAVAYFEWKLWGRIPSPRFGDIPLRETRGRLGWVELLIAARPTLAECEALRELSNPPREGVDDPPEPAETWLVGQHPEGRFLYWDGSHMHQNPYLRVSDVDKRFVQDLAIEYSLNFAPTRKDDAAAQKNALRDAIGAGAVEFLPTAGPVIDHVKEARFNEKRTEWIRHPIHGHFDCLAALIYLYRNVNKHQNPAVPGVQLVDHLREYLPAHVRKAAAKGDEALEQALFGSIPRDRVSRIAGHKKRPRWLGR